MTTILITPVNAGVIKLLWRLYWCNFGW